MKSSKKSTTGAVESGRLRWQYSRWNPSEGKQLITELVPIFVVYKIQNVYGLWPFSGTFLVCVSLWNPGATISTQVVSPPCRLYAPVWVCTSISHCLNERMHCECTTCTLLSSLLLTLPSLSLPLSLFHFFLCLHSLCECACVLACPRLQLSRSLNSFFRSVKVFAFVFKFYYLLHFRTSNSALINLFIELGKFWLAIWLHTREGVLCRCGLHGSCRLDLLATLFSIIGD